MPRLFYDSQLVIMAEREQGHFVMAVVLPCLSPVLGLFLTFCHWGGLCLSFSLLSISLSPVSDVCCFPLQIHPPSSPFPVLCPRRLPCMDFIKGLSIPLASFWVQPRRIPGERSEGGKRVKMEYLLPRFSSCKLTSGWPHPLIESLCSSQSKQLLRAF